MKSYLIKDTTREEREEIVRSSCGNNCAHCAMAGSCHGKTK